MKVQLTNCKSKTHEKFNVQVGRRIRCDSGWYSHNKNWKNKTFIAQTVKLRKAKKFILQVG